MSKYEEQFKLLCALEQDFDETSIYDEDFENCSGILPQDAKRYVVIMWEADGPGLRCCESTWSTHANLSSIIGILNEQPDSYHWIDIYDLQNLQDENKDLKVFEYEITKIKLKIVDKVV